MAPGTKQLARSDEELGQVRPADPEPVLTHKNHACELVFEEAKEVKHNLEREDRDETNYGPGGV